MTIYMRHIRTGVIDTLDNWTIKHEKSKKAPEDSPRYLYEMFCSGGEDLVEVRRDEFGDWVEA